MDVSLVKLTVLWRLKNIQSLIDCLTVALSQMSIVWPKQIKVTIYTIIHFEQKTSEIIFPKLIKNKNNEKIKSTRSSKTERNCDIIRRQNRSIPGNFCRWDMHIICSICNRVKNFFPQSESQFILLRYWRHRRCSTDFGDGWWRRNVLATILKCWWQFWPFSSPISSIF